LEKAGLCTRPPVQALQASMRKTWEAITTLYMRNVAYLHGDKWVQGVVVAMATDIWNFIYSN